MRMQGISFNVNDPPEKIFKKIRDDLVRARGTTRQPRMLTWQIHLYDFILARDPVGPTLDAYFKARGGADPRAPRAVWRAAMQRGATAVGFTEPMPPDGT